MESARLPQRSRHHLGEHLVCHSVRNRGASTQFSVYLRHCTGPEQTESLTKRVQAELPEGGKVDILYFTDKQYERIASFVGKKRAGAR